MEVICAFSLQMSTFDLVQSDLLHPRPGRARFSFTLVLFKLPDDHLWFRRRKLRRRHQDLKCKVSESHSRLPETCPRSEMVTALRKLTAFLILRQVVHFRQFKRLLPSRHYSKSTSLSYRSDFFFFTDYLMRGTVHSF